MKGYGSLKKHCMLTQHVVIFVVFRLFFCSSWCESPQKLTLLSSLLRDPLRQKFNRNLFIAIWVDFAYRQTDRLWWDMSHRAETNCSMTKMSSRVDSNASQSSSILGWRRMFITSISWWNSHRCAALARMNLAANISPLDSSVHMHTFPNLPLYTTRTPKYISGSGLQ